MSDFDRAAHLEKARHSISHKCRLCKKKYPEHHKDCPVMLASRLINKKDAIIAAQADIIQRYARHTLLCPLSDYGVTGNNNNCTCGASAALAALRKLQGDKNG